MEPISTKSKTTTFLLAFFLGAFGVHRFYAGKVGSGLAQLFLSLSIVGLMVTGVWVFCDWVVILSGDFKDGDGLKIK